MSTEAGGQAVVRAQPVRHSRKKHTLQHLSLFLSFFIAFIYQRLPFSDLMKIPSSYPSPAVSSEVPSPPSVSSPQSRPRSTNYQAQSSRLRLSLSSHKKTTF